MNPQPSQPNSPSQTETRGAAPPVDPATAYRVSVHEQDDGRYEVRVACATDLLGDYVVDGTRWAVIYEQANHFHPDQARAHGELCAKKFLANDLADNAVKRRERQEYEAGTVVQ